MMRGKAVKDQAERTRYAVHRGYMLDLPRDHAHNPFGDASHDRP